MYTAKELMGRTVTWVSTSSTWKVIGLYSPGEFQLEKVSGIGPFGSKPGTRVPYLIEQLAKGIAKGVVEIVETTDSFEIET